jgi:hypothetical protein
MVRHIMLVHRLLDQLNITSEDLRSSRQSNDARYLEVTKNPVFYKCVSCQEIDRSSESGPEPWLWNLTIKRRQCIGSRIQA